MMRKQSRSPCSSSSSAAVVSLCKVLLMVLALICTLETVSVEGGRVAAAALVGGGVPLNPRYPAIPEEPYIGRRGDPYTGRGGEPYTRPGRGCTVAYGCYGGPPAAKP
uniref:RIR1b protein n=1 Tax=Oryza sativa TaxID=4530 RepID=O24232_ORYSA|nr:RIR1b protein [Oryza sativa Indica Group]